MRREFIRAFLYFLFLTLLFFSRNIIYGKSYTPFSLLNIWFEEPPEKEYGILAQMDGLVIFYANDSLYNEMLKKGEILKWNPYIFSGYPIYANGHSSFHNPFRLLFNFLFPPVFARDLTIFFHMLLTGIFTFLFLRELGFSFFPSLFGGTVWEFCAHNTALIEWLWGPMASAYLVILLYFFIKTLKTGRLYWFALTAIAFCLSLMCGNLQWSLYIFLTWFSFYLFYLYEFLRERNLKKALNLTYIFSGIFILGFLLSSIEIIPTIELIKNSSLQRESHSYESLKTDTLTKINLISTIFYPRLGGSPFDQINMRSVAILSYYLFNGYIGVLPLFLMAGGIFLAFKKREVQFFTICFFISLLIALRTPVLIPVLKIPLVNKMFHDRILFISSFFATLLCVYGLNEFLSNEKRGLKIAFIIIFPSIFIFISLLFLLSWKSAIPSEWFSLFNTALIIPLLLLISSFLLLYGILFEKIDEKTFKVFSVFLLVIDLLPLGMISNTCDSPESLEIMEKLKNEPELKPYERIAGIFPNLSVLLRIPSIEGYDSVYPDWYFRAMFPKAWTKRSRWQVLYNIIPYNLLKMMGTKFVITDGNVNPFENPLKSEGMRFHKSIGKLKIYEIEDPLPRVFVPDRYVIMSEKECLEFLHKKDFSPLEFLILVEIPDGFIPQGMKGKAEILSYSPGEVLISADMETDGFLVLTDTYYPGWKVYVDGNERRIYRAYSFLRAVKLEKGKHEVLFRFSPLTYRTGKIITFIVFILLLLLSPFKITSLVEIKEKNYQLNSQAKPSFLPFLLFPVLLILIYTFLWYHSFSDFRKSRWHFYNGVLLSQIEGPESGIKEMENALSYKTYKPHTYFFLGKLYNEMGKKKEAAEVLEFAKRYFPRDIETNILLIALYRELGMEEKVKAQMKELEKYGRDWSLALERDGFGFLYAQDIKTAIKAFLSAIILNPKRGRAYYGLALAYMMDDNPEEALKAIRTALSLEPDKKAYKSLLEEILKTME